MRIENHARLVVSGFDCPAEAISEILGVQATETWQKGDRVLPIARNTHKENGWLLASPADSHGASIDEAIGQLLDILPSNVDFGQLPLGVEIEIACSIYSYGARPSFSLQASTITRISKCGAELDVDVYELPDGSS